jgi:hypothetical protein
LPSIISWKISLGISNCLSIFLKRIMV